jgi:hypothetical protein
VFHDSLILILIGGANHLNKIFLAILKAKKNLTRLFPCVSFLNKMLEEGESKIGNKVTPLRLLSAVLVVDEEEDIGEDFPDTGVERFPPLMLGDRLSRDEYSRPSLPSESWNRSKGETVAQKIWTMHECSNADALTHS